MVSPKTVICLFLSFIKLNSVDSQSAIVSMGGEGQGSMGSISFSVGQVADQYYVSGVGQINEGVQQPFEFFSNTTNTFSQQRFSFSLYPNPTQDLLWIQTRGDLPEGLQYCLLDVMGRKVQDGTIDQFTQEISLKLLMPAIYTVLIRHEGILIGATPLAKIQ